MLTHHTFLTVEDFSLRNDRIGAFDNEITLAGWFLSHVQPTALKLAFPGGIEIRIEDCGIESSDVHALHGHQFGDAARQCRFRLCEPVGARKLDLSAAIIRVEIERTLTIEVPVGTQYVEMRKDEFTDDERALVGRFESVGDNCELGLVQRRIGVERLGLLRYAGVGDPWVLAEAIEAGFNAFDGADEVMLGPSWRGDEWIAHIPAARIALHTGRQITTNAHDGMLAAESAKLRFLIQKFLDDCEEGEKVFVWRVLRDERGGPRGERGMARLYDALAALGANRLLWVNEVDGSHPHASIEHVRDGLYRGWIDRLTPHSDAYSFRPRSWIELLAAAERAMSAGGNPA